MTFTKYFLLIILTIVQLSITDTWSTTSTNCLWHEYAFNDRLSKRIDLRDVRNQLLS